jgi:hypothetical protein
MTPCLDEGPVDPEVAFLRAPPNQPSRRIAQPRARWSNEPLPAQLQRATPLFFVETTQRPHVTSKELHVSTVSASCRAQVACVLSTAKEPARRVQCHPPVPPLRAETHPSQPLRPASRALVDHYTHLLPLVTLEFARLTSALHPRRFTIAPSAVGCKRLLGGMLRPWTDRESRSRFAALILTGHQWNGHA